MTAEEAEALPGGASRDRAGRNPGMARAGAEADTAGGAQPKSERDWLMGQVVERGNMQRAYSQVMRNRGAPGIDGMRCEDLKDWLKSELAASESSATGRDLPAPETEPGCAAQHRALDRTPGWTVSMA